MLYPLSYEGGTVRRRRKGSRRGHRSERPEPGRVRVRVRAVSSTQHQPHCDAQTISSALNAAIQNGVGIQSLAGGGAIIVAVLVLHHVSRGADANLPEVAQARDQRVSNSDAKPLVVVT